MLSGADSQCAETMRTAFGLGSARAQECSSVIQSVISNSIGAPWLRYRLGSGPSSGVHRRWAAARSASAARRRCAANGCWPGIRRSAIAVVLDAGGDVMGLLGAKAVLLRLVRDD